VTSKAGHNFAPSSPPRGRGLGRACPGGWASYHGRWYREWGLVTALYRVHPGAYTRNQISYQSSYSEILDNRAFASLSKASSRLSFATNCLTLWLRLCRDAFFLRGSCIRPIMSNVL